jgi:hypothetical protein
MLAVVVVELKTRYCWWQVEQVVEVQVQTKMQVLWHSKHRRWWRWYCTSGGTMVATAAQEL